MVRFSEFYVLLIFYTGPQSVVAPRNPIKLFSPSSTRWTSTRSKNTDTLHAELPPVLVLVAVGTAMAMFLFFALFGQL